MAGGAVDDRGVGNIFSIIYRDALAEDFSGGIGETYGS